MKNICLQMNRKVLMTLLLAISVVLPALAQKITVQGTVVDNTGEPLIGASVMAQGTTTGTATDFDGAFTLSVDPNATLVVSYVGYEPANVAVNGQTSLKVTLQEAGGVQLNEVVAIGYGTVKKNDATGSVSTVKPSEIQAGLATSAQDLLVGQTPGVVVTTSAGPQGAGTIRIRGGSSLSASNDPLIVVDGVPMSNDGILGMSNPLATISPDNIENMTVLKDASATAIYGSRASNGVIIITTKKGKSGKPQVNFTANMYVNTARNTWDMLSGDEFRTLVRNHFGEDSDAAKALGTANTDWQKEVLRTAISHDYNLSVGGQEGILPYRFSASYTGNNGILKESYMDRATLGMTFTPKLFNDHLSITANLKGYYISASDDDLSAVGNALSSDPTSPAKFNYPMATKGWTLYNGYTAYLGNGGTYNTNGTMNPLAVIEGRDAKSEVWRSTGNLQLDYSLHFLPELHLNLNVGYDVSTARKNSRNLQNSPQSWTSSFKNGAETLYEEDQFNSNTLLDFYANYKKEFEAIRSIVDFTAGYSWQRFHQEGWNNGTIIQSLGFNLPTQNADGTYNLTLDNSTADLIGTRYTVTDNPLYEASKQDGKYYYANHLQLLSFFGRLNYTFMDRYLVTATVRGDATSRFSKDNRWGVFPSVALGWKIAEESFMEGVRDWMNEWKLRLGWGVTGQQAIGINYPYLAIYQSSTQGSYYPSLNGVGGNVSTLYPQGYDPNLKWEETTTWNAGFDFGFLNNRITAAIDYYYRETKDLLSYVTIPVGSNTTNMLNQNIGSLENQGVEFSITARPVVTNDLTWTVNYNVAYNQNKITKLNNDGSYITTGGISGGTGNNCQIQKPGYPAYSFWLYQQVYDANGNPIEGEYVDQDGDGVIGDGDRVIRHSKDPKVTMSFSTTLNWKNWDFGISLRASLGNYVYNNVMATRSTLSKINEYGLHNVVDTDFYFDGTKSTNSLYNSDYWLRNASYLRCDNITLGYTWNNLLKDQLRLRLYGAVQNPFVITKYNGLDPEVESGIDNNVYPRPMTFTLGVVASF